MYKNFKLISEKLPTLDFKPHFNAEGCDTYLAISLFISNNWKILGSYEVVAYDEAGNPTTFSGVNLEDNLAHSMAGTLPDHSNCD